MKEYLYSNLEVKNQIESMQNGTTYSGIKRSEIDMHPSEPLQAPHWGQEAGAYIRAAAAISASQDIFNTSIPSPNMPKPVPEIVAEAERIIKKSVEVKSPAIPLQATVFSAVR